MLDFVIKEKTDFCIYEKGNYKDLLGFGSAYSVINPPPLDIPSFWIPAVEMED